MSVESFNVAMVPAINQKTLEGVVEFGVEDTPYKTVWTSQEAINFGVQMIVTATIARYQGNLYAFMGDVMGLGENEIQVVFQGIALYSGADETERKRIAVQARAALDAGEGHAGIPPEEM